MYTGFYVINSEQKVTLKIVYIINFTFSTNGGKTAITGFQGRNTALWLAEHQYSREPLVWIFELPWVSADPGSYDECYSKEETYLSQTAAVVGNGMLSILEIRRSMLPQISYSLILCEYKLNEGYIARHAIVLEELTFPFLGYKVQFTLCCL